jgi:hypothetical protein
MGRAFFIKHRTSHLTIGVRHETNGGPRPPATRSPRTAPARETAAAATPAPKPARARGRKPATRKSGAKGKEKK